jgi:hypothetical protein
MGLVRGGPCLSKCRSQLIFAIFNTLKMYTHKMSLKKFSLQYTTFIGFKCNVKSRLFFFSFHLQSTTKFWFSVLTCGPAWCKCCHFQPCWWCWVKGDLTIHTLAVALTVCRHCSFCCVMGTRLTCKCQETWGVEGDVGCWWVVGELRCVTGILRCWGMSSLNLVHHVLTACPHTCPCSGPILSSDQVQCPGTSDEHKCPHNSGQRHNPVPSCPPHTKCSPVCTGPTPAPTPGPRKTCWETPTPTCTGN